MNKLSVVIPAWNEEDAVAQVIERILRTGDALRARAGITDLEIIVVDDGSTDRTADIVAQMATGSGNKRTSVYLIRHEVNRGYGAALKSGFAWAGGQLLAFLDADCTYPPEELPALCQALATPGLAMVVGDRMTSRASQMPVLRRVGNAFFAFLVSLLGGERIADCASGMRVLPAATLHELGDLPEGLDFTPAMTMRTVHKHLAVRELPIPYHQRVGRSKLSVARDGLRFLGTILRETWTYNPARLAGTVGLIVILPAFTLIAASAGLAALPAPVSLPWLLGAGVGVIVLLAGLLWTGARMRTGVAPSAFEQALRSPVAGAGQPLEGRRSARSDEYACTGEAESMAVRSR